MERLPIEVGIAVTAQSGPYYGHYDYYAENRTSTIVAHTLGAMAIGLFGAGLFVVLVPHWKRVMYMVGLIAFTLAACIFAGAVWHLDQSVSEREVFPIGDAIAWQGWLFVCTVITGIISIFLARPLARLTIRMLLVPRLRPALGYLWEADGLEPPKPVTKKS